MKKVQFLEIEGKSDGFWFLLGSLGVFLVMGLASAYYMEHAGHVVTGMNNQIVWGIPHVFAVFLIVAASGALNAASFASVFNKTVYKPVAPLSALLAIALLVGGLMVLVLDLGRPDRLIVAMTTYNFKSIFAWNIFLYNGFLVIVAIYIWMMMERRFNKYSSTVGTVAFIWRLLLTTGTGSIFGFLVARQAYDAAIMAPMFILMSFAFGMAIFIIVLVATYRWSQRPIGVFLLRRLRKLLAIFIGAVLLVVLAYHLTNLYATEHHGIERFILLDGGVITFLFWGVQIFLGGLIPLGLLLAPGLKDSNKALVWSAIFVVAGGLAQMYVILIGGQSFPLELFPGFEISSSFYDGVISTYRPSLPEILLGLGGMALSGLVLVMGIKILKFLPVSLADAEIDPHHK